MHIYTMKFINILLIIVAISLLFGCVPKEEVNDNDNSVNLKSMDDSEKSITVSDELNSNHEEFIAAHPKAAQFSVDITGEELVKLTFEDVGVMWGIDPELYLLDIRTELNLQDEYVITDKIEKISDETFFKPKKLKELAENLAN